MEWIKVEDRKPRKDKYVIVAFDDGTTGFAKYSPAEKPYHNKELCWKQHGKRFSNVTHWMHLPKAP